MKIKNIIIIILLVITNWSCFKRVVPDDTVTKTELINDVATSTFKVWGNCEMCKETIMKAVDISGVLIAEWDPDTNLMKVVYDKGLVTLDDIQKSIALYGYDNTQYNGNDSAYNQLSECCKYERTKLIKE